MKTRTLVIWLLIAACVLVDIATMRELARQVASWPDQLGILGLGLAFGQTVLITAWMVWGRWNVFLRIMVAIFATFGLTWLASASTYDNSDVNLWFAVMLIYLSLLAIPMVSARLMGYSICEPGQIHELPSQSKTQQFSIWSLLSVMTAVAVIFGVLRFAGWIDGELTEASLFNAILATASCLLLFTGLLFRQRFISVVTALFVCPIAGYLLSLTHLAPGDDANELIELSCANGIVVVACVLVLRSAGYVMRRDARLPRTASACRTDM